MTGLINKARRPLLGAVMLCASLAVHAADAQEALTIRTPATPLVVHDPYFSIWSMRDDLAKGPTRHWTGREQRLTGMARVDGKLLRFMGDGPGEAMTQTKREIWPTRTIYEYEGAGIRVTATFLTPSLPQDLDTLSRPITYLSWEVRATDGRQHDVDIYIDAGADLAVNEGRQRVVWGSSTVEDMTVMRIGTQAQPMLEKSGDDLRIDWGWAQLVVPGQAGGETAIVGQRARDAYLENGGFADSDDLAMPRRAFDDRPLMATHFALGSIGDEAVIRRAMLAYDDIESIEYFDRHLSAYWRQNGMTMAELLIAAERDEPKLRERAVAFDRALVRDLERVGGREYADIAILAFRQSIGAHKLVADIDGTPLFFSKENNSNGCIATVDITYPSSPLYLLLNPALLQAQMLPILQYAALPRWKFPFAPHDIGTYPLANGQVYGGGERSAENQMPVEESGNMLIMLAALAKAQGNADLAGSYWPLITKWAEYLREKGMDPENQLSTDDFAGHLAHNTNLSIKAIVALDSYSQLAKRLGKNDVATEYRALAKRMAGKWVTMAREGDHTRLAFDQPEHGARNTTLFGTSCWIATCSPTTCSRARSLSI